MTTSTGTKVDTPEPHDGRRTGRTRRRYGVRIASAAAVALGLVVAGGAVVGATTPSTSPSDTTRSGPPHGRPPGGNPPVAVGTVQTVGNGSFALLTAGGKTVTVQVSSSTAYRDRGVASPSLADVTAGQHVAVFGSDSSGTVTATTVAIGVPPNGSRPNAHCQGGPTNGASANGAAPNGAAPNGAPANDAPANGAPRGGTQPLGSEGEQSGQATS